MGFVALALASGTDTAADDMDTVRAALGEEQLSYLGFSYGTALGTAYAERYPDRVRAMAAIPSSESSGARRDRVRSYWRRKWWAASRKISSPRSKWADTSSAFG